MRLRYVCAPVVDGSYKDARRDREACYYVRRRVIRRKLTSRYGIALYLQRRDTVRKIT